MRILGILTVAIMFLSLGLCAQVMEIEPNDFPNASGTITVGTGVTIEGNVCGSCAISDPFDLWNIADGSSGNFIAYWSDNISVRIFTYSTSARNTAPTNNTLLSSGNAVVLSADSFYSLTILGLSLGTLIDYSVVLGNRPPTASDFTGNDIYEGLSHVFSTSDFGYLDADGDLLSAIRLSSVSIFNRLYIDANDNDSFDIGENLSDGSIVSKADLDAGNLQCIPLLGTDVTFRFEVSDGEDYSATSYEAVLPVIPIPDVTLTIDNTSDLESTPSNNMVTATLSNAYAADTRVNLSFSGTATPTTDYTRTAEFIMIPAGSTSGTINLNNVSDGLIEADETIIIDIESVTNGTESGIQQITYTILDDDVAELTILRAGDGAEGAFIDGTFLFSISTVLPTPVEFSFTISGSATSGTDYDDFGTSLTFPANRNQFTFFVPVIDDNLVESDETITLTLTDTSNADMIIGATDEATLSIIDLDFAELSIAATTQATEDGTDGLFTISTTKEFSTPVTVNISTTGTATSGADYSSLGSSFVFPANTSTTTLPIEVLADHLVESDETVTVTMADTNNSSVTIGAMNETTISITDNDLAELSVAATTQAAEEATDGLFTMTTTNPFSTDVTVDITVGGSATPGADYASIGTQVVFPANQNTMTIPIDVMDDDIFEIDETVSVTMTGTNNTKVTIGDTDEATVTITDDDESVLSIVATTQASEDVNTGLFTISTSKQFLTTTEVTFTLDGSAIPGTDYSDLGTSFTFPANTSSVPITVAVIEDEIDESDETIILTLSCTNNADVVIGVQNSATINLVDDDETPIVTASQVFAVDEDAKNTDAIGFVVATDPDPETTWSDWTIQTGNEDGIFTIDAASGQLRVIDRSNLDREVTASYTLSITVTDGTNTSEAEDIVININDINDELPVISTGQEFTIVGEILSGAVVGTVLATDQDFTETVFQNWTITENNTNTDGDSDLPFTIDKSTGVITINDTDDINSSQSIFQLALTVSDGINTSLAEIVTINAEIEVSNQAFLPNLFTPNNDGKNDKFIVRGGRDVQSIKLSVMDRNSNVVFESSDWQQLSQQGWDGTSGGKEQPSGAYIWVVRGTSDDGTPFRINGKDTGVIRISR